MTAAALATRRAWLCPGQRGREPAGRSVVRLDVPLQLMTVLRIVGWDSAPGLTQENGTPARFLAGTGGVLVAAAPATGGQRTVHADRCAPLTEAV